MFMPRCLPRRRAYRLRVVVCTRTAAKRRIHRESILQTGKMELQQLRHCGSATSMQRKYIGRPSAAYPKNNGVKGMNCLCAAQLGAAPDRAPSLGPVLNAPRAIWLACVNGQGT